MQKPKMKEIIKFRAPAGTARRLKRVAKMKSKAGLRPLSPPDVVREALNTYMNEAERKEQTV